MNLLALLDSLATREDQEIDLRISLSPVLISILIFTLLKNPNFIANIVVTFTNSKIDPIDTKKEYLSGKFEGGGSEGILEGVVRDWYPIGVAGARPKALNAKVGLISPTIPPSLRSKAITSVKEKPS